MWLCLYRHQSHIHDHHTMKNFVLCRVTVWWPWQYKIFHSMVIVMCDWCLYSTVTHHDHHTMKNFVLCQESPYWWLYIVQNVHSMVIVMCDWCLYRHQSHITITILWKILYCQGHHTVTLHSTKCASYEVWWPWQYKIFHSMVIVMCHWCLS